MTDRIFEIGEAALSTSDEKVRKLMDNMVGSEIPGYRKSDVKVTAFPLALEAAQNKISPMIPQTDGTFYSTVHGALIKTDKKLDLALGCDGYFVVQGSWGEGYTRDGRFTVDRDGRVLTVAGNFPVMGRSGPIVVGSGANIEFTQDGELRVDGNIVDVIRVVNPTSFKQLESLNGTIFKSKDQGSPLLEVENPRVIQGYVEASNVNIVDQMMEMVLLENIYNNNAKIISTRDGNLARAMELGKPTQ